MHINANLTRSQNALTLLIPLFRRTLFVFGDSTVIRLGLALQWVVSLFHPCATGNRLSFIRPSCPCYWLRIGHSPTPHKTCVTYRGHGHKQGYCSHRGAGTSHPWFRASGPNSRMNCLVFPPPSGAQRSTLANVYHFPYKAALPQ
jgi:hypothetical protein